MRLTMVGSGYVGLVTGACLANTGNDVICLDVDADKIARLRRGEPTIYEPGLANMIERNTKANRLSFTSDAAEAYRDAEIIFISVGTPTGADGAPDLSYVLSAADEIAVAIEAQPAGSAPKLVVVKSTVPVGTTHRVRDRIREHTNKPFLIANNPEFLKEGAAISDFIKPDRVVCGVEEDFAAEILRDLYNPFVLQGNPILVMDIRSSEMVKYASNAMLACKISFINEIANLCEHYDADVRSVREGMCADHRIGNQFLFPGLGYGGSCFPKDTLAVIDMGRNAGCDCALNTAVHDVNQRQRDRFWSKIAGHFGGEMAGKRLAFWGIAFKPQTDDIREAPAVDLMERALAAGAEVRAFDPAAAAVLAKRLPAVVTCDSMYDTVDGADALVVCTEWSEFRHPDLDRIATLLKNPVIFDGRNIYRRHQMERMGYTYYAVGRPVVNPLGAMSAETAPRASGVNAPA